MTVASCAPTDKSAAFGITVKVVLFTSSATLAARVCSDGCVISKSSPVMATTRLLIASLVVFLMVTVSVAGAALYSLSGNVTVLVADAIVPPSILPLTPIRLSVPVMISSVVSLPANAMVGMKHAIIMILMSIANNFFISFSFLLTYKRNLFGDFVSLFCIQRYFGDLCF